MEFDYFHYPTGFRIVCWGLSERWREMVRERFLPREKRGAIRSLLYPVLPGIRIKCVVHTRADRTEPNEREKERERGGAVVEQRPARGCLLGERSSLAVSGPELQMISNRIACNIIRYVFHYWPTLGLGIQIRLPPG